MTDFHGRGIGYGTAESVEDLKRQIDELRKEGDRRDDFDTFFFWDDLGVWVDSFYNSESAQIWRIWLWNYLVDEAEMIDDETLMAAESYDEGIADAVESFLEDYRVEEFDY